MTVYYVRKTGSDGNAGTSAGAAKLTIQAAVNVATTAGDTIYVGAGSYAETVTLAASGSAGNVISIIGDYTGAQTGDAGVVRITGSNDNITATRANCINTSTRSYVTIRGFVFDLATGSQITSTDARTDITIERCVFMDSGSTTVVVNVGGASQLRWTLDRCVFIGGRAAGVFFNHTVAVNDTGHIVRNCLWTGGSGATGVNFGRIGGGTVVNCAFLGLSIGVIVGSALTVGQTTTVNNCIFRGMSSTALSATAVGEITENYNALFNCSTNRSNTSTGANSNSYPHLPDVRPWFQATLDSGTLALPFDLASYCALVELNSGTGAPSTDLRGASATGTYREWGPLEYNAALAIEGGGGVTMWPLSNGFIQAIIGGGV